MPKNQEANPLFDQLLAIQENAAQIVEGAEQSFCSSIGFICWDELTEEERCQVHDWHKTLQNAVKALRDIEE